MALTELTQVFVALTSLLPSVVYALSYAIGGRENAPVFHGHYWRRIVAPLSFSLLTLGLISLFNPSNLSFISLSSPLIYVGVHWLGGYGGNVLWVKIIRRTWTGLLMGLASLPFAFQSNSWTLFSFQIVLGCLAHLVLGLKNPLIASKEEFVIAFLTVVLVPYMVV